MTDTTKKTISEVLIGMAVYLVIASIFVLIFTKDKLKGEGGLLVGTVAGVLMLFSMKHTIYKAMHAEGTFGIPCIFFGWKDACGGCGARCDRLFRMAESYYHICRFLRTQGGDLCPAFNTQAYRKSN